MSHSTRPCTRLRDRDTPQTTMWTWQRLGLLWLTGWRPVGRRAYKPSALRKLGPGNASHGPTGPLGQSARLMRGSGSGNRGGIRWGLHNPHIPVSTPCSRPVPHRASLWLSRCQSWPLSSPIAGLPPSTSPPQRPWPLINFDHLILWGWPGCDLPPMTAIPPPISAHGLERTPTTCSPTPTCCITRCCPAPRGGHLFFGTLSSS